MSLVSYGSRNPFNKFYQQLNHLAYADNLFVDNENDHSLTSSWQPAVDIKEEENCFLIVADVPGVDPKDIEITMENGMTAKNGI